MKIKSLLFFQMCINILLGFSLCISFKIMSSRTEKRKEIIGDLSRQKDVWFRYADTAGPDDFDPNKTLTFSVNSNILNLEKEKIPGGKIRDILLVASQDDADQKAPEVVGIVTRLRDSYGTKTVFDLHALISDKLVNSEGATENDSQWYIGLAQKNDSLPDCSLETYKSIFLHLIPEKNCSVLRKFFTILALWGIAKNSSFLTQFNYEVEPFIVFDQEKTKFVIGTLHKTVEASDEGVIYYYKLLKRLPKVIPMSINAILVSSTKVDSKERTALPFPDQVTNEEITKLSEDPKSFFGLKFVSLKMPPLYYQGPSLRTLEKSDSTLYRLVIKIIYERSNFFHKTILGKEYQLDWEYKK